MDEPKVAFPPWLAWLLIGCLAALVACLGELLMLEKTRARLMSDQAELSAAALKASDNQLEAERIISSREFARSGIEVAILSPTGDARAWACLAWRPGSGQGRLVGRGLADGNYSLVLGKEASTPFTASGGAFDRALSIPPAFGPGDPVAVLREDGMTPSIVLASAPSSGGNSLR